MNDYILPSRLLRYLYQGNNDKALAYLSRITSLNQENLFTAYDEGYLRFIGQFRIQYLLDMGYYREALAWACLECELYPDNIESFAVKDSIKNEIKNLPAKKPVKKSKLNARWGPVAGMRSVKALIERDFLRPLFDHESFKKYHLTIPTGLLLYGPPGCGKTFIIRQLAKIFEFNYIEVI